MKRRFSAQISTAQKGLEKVMERMDAVNYEIIQRNGHQVIIMFILQDEKGFQREYRYICDQFENIADNFRAAQLALDYLWRIHDDYQVRAEGGDPSLQTVFQGFRVLPSQQVLLKSLPDPEKREPWEILGITRDANRDEINKAFRELSKTHHPDKGGTQAGFVRIITAKDDMVAIL